ncbi:hypothetical protein K1T71_013875 [Dendrolimus kikuchii]|uniref:Uncharacterized protein n=1 Tax=Dendrolimus kikuchii TaxID=765133 RepID=A0ACC1CG10_9NEOP|nr:hypothetical protein K1T71_013875 [Dendrolimus kikuchii]
MNHLIQFLHLPLRYHLIIGIFIRLILVLYSNYHDKYFDVAYTDVDYKVFTDAARHVVSGQSPYKRHTYRYSPLIAYLMIPNIIIAKEFGKIMFSLFDILVTIAIKALVKKQIASSNAENLSTFCSLFWLYNPLSIGISTRGNADSVPCFFIIISLLFLQTETVKGFTKYIFSGIFLGIAIHLRLYPLAFSFPMYLSLGNYKIKRSTRIVEGIWTLLPNIQQITLAFSCIATLFLLTYSMYIRYGYEFLFETYIYHLFRKDTRHNFSVFFYYSYLTMDQLSFDIIKTISQIFEVIILFVVSLTFGTDSKSLPFALFCQSVVLVAFNSVMTSQYFIWFLSLLPLVILNFRLARPKAIFLGIIWIAAQLAWLFYAYLLEFKCREVFILIWLKGVIFFCTNIYVLGQLIKSYNPSVGHVAFIDDKIKY